MPRIRTDEPSSGRPLLFFIPSTINSGFVPTAWTTVPEAEAPDFSVPSLGDVVDPAGITGPIPDPADPIDRILRPGEVLFEAPLNVVNTTATTCWVELRIQLEGTSGQIIPFTQQVPVPANESVQLAIQGQRLLKRNLSNSQPGGRLQIRAQVGNALTIYGTGIEIEMQAHAPDLGDD
jgi:hypothetical protein